MHLYLHIPFCKQACHYCDFHFSTTQKNRDALLSAMITELERRRAELPSAELETIYFGGGTPSLLSEDELQRFFGKITEHFTILPGAEITLEANPDDLDENYLRQLRRTPVNRLSIGIQSFRDEDLRLMNRAHSAAEAESVVKAAQDAGFSNLTIDLIYGIPGLNENDWMRNLEKAGSLGVQHLSSYCLTVEPRTALAHFVQQGKIRPVDEEQASAQFLALVDFATANGFAQYEISNFAKPGFIAKHNSSYWTGDPYLGIGPSAHSYNGTERRWNIANNAQYIRMMAENKSTYEAELLTENERYNEFLMTRLRTSRGILLGELEQNFGEEAAKNVLAGMQDYLESGDALLEDGRIFLSPKGRLLADRIASELFRV